MEVEHMQLPSLFNPEGIKGAGEGGTIGAIPTCVAAVEDALAPFGARLNHVPVRSKDLVQMVPPRAA
jgi:carbon-monoxide dehydrogenase large subunit